MVSRGKDHVAQVHRPTFPARVYEHVPRLFYHDRAFVDHGPLFTRFDKMHFDPSHEFTGGKDLI
jgi:hypothetical protein